MIIVPIWLAVVMNMASVAIIFLVLPESVLVAYVALMVALAIALAGYATNGYYIVAGLHVAIIIGISALMLCLSRALHRH